MSDKLEGEDNLQTAAGGEEINEVASATSLKDGEKTAEAGGPDGEIEASELEQGEAALSEPVEAGGEDSAYEDETAAEDEAEHEEDEGLDEQTAYKSVSEDEKRDAASTDDESDSMKQLKQKEKEVMERQRKSGDEVGFDLDSSPREVIAGDDGTKFIEIEETIMDDLGKQVTIKQRVPILKETRRYERVSIVPDDGSRSATTHKFLETITRVVMKSKPTEDGEFQDEETEITEIVEHDTKPKEATKIYTKKTDSDGNVIDVLLEDKDEPSEPQAVESVTSIQDETVQAEPVQKPKAEPKIKSRKPTKITKKDVFKVYKELRAEPCSHGKIEEVIVPTKEEVEIEEEEESDIESFETDEELSEEELERQKEEIERKKQDRVMKLKDNLRTVLVRLALAKKKRNLYMQLISISSEVKEDILSPPDPKKPSFKVPKKVKAEDKFKKMYFDKLMEYRELRSVILVKLALEKKRKEEVKAKYDVIAAQVAEQRKEFQNKLHTAIKQFLPKNDTVFKNQSAEALVGRVLELIERLDKETKELMYKKKQMYLSKQKYDEVTENEEGLSYKYALANKELNDLIDKNQRRNEKLLALKSALQKECMAITQINQKVETIMKLTNEKQARLEYLSQNLQDVRQDRRDVHTARRKIGEQLNQERVNVALKNYPHLFREYQLVEELLRSKQLEFQQLKRECLSSLDRSSQPVRKS